MAADGPTPEPNAAAVADRAQFLARLLQDSSQPFAVGYPDGRLGECNAAYAALLGYTLEELASMSWQKSLTPDEWRDRERPILERLTRTGQPQVYEKEYVRKDGGRVPVELRAHLVRDASGVPAYYYAFVSDISARKRAQAALRDSEQRLREVLDSTTDGVVSLDADYRITVFNAESERVCGMRREDVLGRRWQEVFPPLAGTALEAEMTRCMRDRVPVEAENFYADWGRWFLIRAYPTPDGGCAQFYRDVTEQKRAAAAISQNQRMLYELIERCPFGIYIVDASLRIATLNRESEEVTFANVRPIVGRQLGEAMRVLWPADVAAEIVGRFRRTLETSEPYYSRDFVRARSDTGQVEGYEWQLHRVTLPDGQPGVICYYYDSTGLRDVERSLDEARARLELAIDAAELGTFYCPMPLGAILWNAKCKEHFWLPPDAEIDFDLFYAILHPDDREPTRRAIGDALRRRLPYDVEYRTVAPDGRTRWIRAKGRAYFDAGGEPTRFDGITIDVSELKRTEESRARLLDAERAARSEAERVSRMKDEFLATLSHELRTPLNAILGWSQVLQRAGASDPKTVAEGAAVIARNARAQARLIEDLLDMSRIVSGKLRFDVRPVNLAEVVAAAIDSIAPSAQAKGVRIERDLWGDAAVAGDASRLQQVAWNLLTNAVKFTPPGGAVRVRLGRGAGDGHVELEVADTGQGIAPEFLPFLFERFRQADASTTRQHGGLGIGLALVKQIVELHNGTVRATSGGVGRGATFAVSLPAAPGDANAGTGAAPPAPRVRADLGGVSIVFVDDEPDARAVGKRILEACGATVAVAAGASEAVALVRDLRPRALVSDIGMPGLDGYDLIRLTRELPPDAGGRTPAVALTAFARPEDRRRALDAGYQAHVAKPVEPDELIAAVAALVGLA